MKQECPILEFDSSPTAILNPMANAVEGGLPEACVLCFFFDVLRLKLAQGELKKIGELQSENGEMPIYLYQQGDQQVAVMNPQVGAPLSAAVMERMIAHGCKKFIIAGGAGALVHELDVTHLVIPVSAVRDEGVSYHYLPPSREVEADPEGVAMIEATLKRWDLPYIKSKAWTTSGIYRETEKKRELRLAEGCTVVEMEAAAFFAVAKFRGVQVAQLLYAGDLVVPDGWDKRGWTDRMDIRTHLFEIAIETVLEWSKS